MSWCQTNPPNISDYTSFLYDVVDIPPANLPPSSEIIPTSLQIAVDTVNEQLLITGVMYVLAVYNLAADRLLNYAIDIPNQTYFKQLRKTLRLNDPTFGVPAAGSDAGTAVSIFNPEVMKNLTLMDLQTLRTPYGREYMGIAQSVGSIWGLN